MHHINILFDVVIHTGTYSTPHDKWQLGLDIKVRGGFIRELPAHHEVSCVENNAVLRFTLNITIKELHSAENNFEYLCIDIMHLKSYENAGKILLHVVCAGHVQKRAICVRVTLFCCTLRTCCCIVHNLDIQCISSDMLL